MKTPVIVEHYVTLTPSQDGQAVGAVCRFDSSIPYEISLAFVHEDLPFTFVIDRKTLADGLYNSTTGHHVLVGPHKDNKLRTVLVFTPTAEQGGGEVFSMYASRRGLWSFIAETMAAVPYGREEEHLDLDLVIARLLGVAS